jgi:uncharacterized protein (DUF2062 family)
VKKMKSKYILQLSSFASLIVCAICLGYYFKTNNIFFALGTFTFFIVMNIYEVGTIILDNIEDYFKNRES